MKDDELDDFNARKGMNVEMKRPEFNANCEDCGALIVAGNRCRECEQLQGFIRRHAIKVGAVRTVSKVADWLDVSTGTLVEIESDQGKGYG